MFFATGNVEPDGGIQWSKPRFFSLYGKEVVLTEGENVIVGCRLNVQMKTGQAQLDGCGPVRIIFRHMLPSFLSHIIATVSLAIPGMILAETALSFLRLGLRPPTISWGVLLQDAQNPTAITLHPWLLFPAAFVMLTVLAYNFVGDGLRDAADPYTN